MCCGRYRGAHDYGYLPSAVLEGILQMQVPIFNKMAEHMQDSQFRSLSRSFAGLPRLRLWCVPTGMHPILAVCASIPLAEARQGSMLRNTSLALLFSALVAFAPGLAAQTSASKASAAKTSFLQAFPAEAERLPKGYRGIDAKRFFALFTSRSATLKRGEYETTEEYQARTGDLGRTLAPISPDVLYAFRAEDFDVEYDADSEQFNVYRSNVCQDRTSHEGSFGL